MSVIARYHLKNGPKSRRRMLRKIKRDHPGAVVDLLNYKPWQGMKSSVRVSEPNTEAQRSPASGDKLPPLVGRGEL